jgi:hypothetical protein
MRTPNRDLARAHTCQEPVLALLDLVGPQRLHHSNGEAERAPGLLGLDVTMRAHRPPNGYVGRDGRIGIRIAVQIHVIPPQRTGLLGAAAC